MIQMIQITQMIQMIQITQMIQMIQNCTVVVGIDDTDHDREVGIDDLSKVSKAWSLHHNQAP